MKVCFKNAYSGQKGRFSKWGIGHHWRQTIGSVIKVIYQLLLGVSDDYPIATVIRDKLSVHFS
jgi:hypothetical protein